MVAPEQRWIQRPRPRQDSTLRLFCFPYSGGAAQAFRRWPELLPPEVEVCPIQPPGRWERSAEPAYTLMQPMVEAATEAIAPLLDRPYAFFGHSTGAVVAYEIVRRLCAFGYVLPRILLVSGRRAPQLPHDVPSMMTLSDDDFVLEMQRRYGGIPRDVVSNPDLMRVIVPVLRADIALFENYRWQDGPPLDCPISALAGREDPVAPPVEMAPWQKLTRASFKLRRFPGAHFFIHGEEQACVAAIASDLRETRGPR